MAERTINLRDLLILVADPSPYLCLLIHGMLRGFGANKVLEVRDSPGVLETLNTHKIDVLLCDGALPVLLMSSETREATIKAGRDAGANMVVAKPLSPASLYDRLAWVAFNPRQFIDTETYFGPDRRFKIEGYPNGVGRRKGDGAIEVAKETGPALAQDDIDSLFNAARTGQS
jgi:CheY-like chemotaxis protein